MIIENIKIPPGKNIDSTNNTILFRWLYNNVINYGANEDGYQSKFTLDDKGKINVDGNVEINMLKENIEYKFGVVIGDFKVCWCDKLTSLIGCPDEVGGSFNCNYCKKLTSLIGAPEKIGGRFDFMAVSKLISFKGFPKMIDGDFIYLTNDKFSNDTKDKERYKLYLAMWLELFESVNNEDRLEYIYNYKDKYMWYNHQPIIPIEIMKEYGF